MQNKASCRVEVKKVFEEKNFRPVLQKYIREKYLVCIIEKQNPIYCSRGGVSKRRDNNAAWELQESKSFEL